MIFNQAFYSRQSRIGLGIVASSNPSSNFLKGCLNVGSNFEMENQVETSEFVYFSKDFDCFVGVGVSPASYENSSGQNKLVHIWVPQETSDNPDDYYLQYTFDRELNSDGVYGEKEFRPCLHEKDYPALLENYYLSENELAVLLWKLLPVLTNEKNQLAIILPEGDKSQYPSIAREFTWLMSMLVPAVDAEKILFRRNLSYAVLSARNNNIVKIVYTSDPADHKNVFFLGMENKEEVPQIYHLLAEKALQSLDAYREFIEDLNQYRLGKNTNTESFDLTFRYWQLENTDCRIRKEDLAISLETIIKRAKDRRNYGNTYRKFLYSVCCHLDRISPQDLIMIHREIFKEDLNTFPKSGDQDFIPAYVRCAQEAYSFANKNDKLYRNGYLQTKDERSLLESNLMAIIFEALWDNGSEDSPIRKDLENAQDGATFYSRLKVYQILCQREDFLAAMQNRAFNGPEFYFDLNPADRYGLRQILNCKPDPNGEKGTDQLLCSRIEDHLWADYPDYLEFLNKEIGKAEDRYAPLYFHFFVLHSQNAESNQRARVQQVGNAFKKFYGKALDHKAEDFRNFENLSKAWYKKDFADNLKLKNLSDLALLSGVNFGDYKIEYPFDAYSAWAQAIRERVENYPEELTEDTVRDLICRENEIELRKIFGEGKTKEYRDFMEERYGTVLQQQLEEMALEDLSICKIPNDIFSGSNYSSLLEKWCTCTTERLQEDSFDHIADDDRNELISFLIKAIREEERSASISPQCKKAYTDAVWDFCGKNLNVRMGCSLSFGNSRYNIWTWMAAEDIADFGLFENLYLIIKEDKTFKVKTRTIDTRSFFITTPVGKVSDSPVSAGEYNRRCYILWENVFIEKARMNLLTLTDFEKIEDIRPFAPSFITFTDILQEELVSSMSFANILDWLALELLKEKYEADMNGSPASLEERCGRYDKLKAHDLKAFDSIMQKPENALRQFNASPQVKDAFNELKSYIQMSNLWDELQNITDELSDEKCSEIAAILYNAEKYLNQKSGLDSNLPLFDNLDKECAEYMKKTRDKIKKAEEEKNRIHENKVQVEKEIEELRKQLREKEDEKDDLEKKEIAKQEQIDNLTLKDKSMRNVREKGIPAVSSRQSSSAFPDKAAETMKKSAASDYSRQASAANAGRSMQGYGNTLSPTGRREAVMGTGTVSLRQDKTSLPDAVQSAMSQPNRNPLPDVVYNTGVRTGKITGNTYDSADSEPKYPEFGAYKDPFMTVSPSQSNTYGGLNNRNNAFSTRTGNYPQGNSSNDETSYPNPFDKTNNTNSNNKNSSTRNNWGF